MTNDTPDVQTEIGGLLRGVAVRALSDRAVLSIRGEDARSWLNGQITNDMTGATATHALYALIVNLQGKILADVFVLERSEDHFDLIVPESARASLADYLDDFVIMEDVQFDADSESVAYALFADDNFTYDSPAASAAWKVEWLGRNATLAVFDSTEAAEAALLAPVADGGGVLVSSDHAWKLAHLRAGRPLYGVDFGESMLPQEAGLKQWAVSFNKGCYQGQEAIVMLEHRGKPPKRLANFQVSADETGVPPSVALLEAAEIVDESGRVWGEITLVLRDPATQELLCRGWIRRKILELGDVDLGAAGFPVEIGPLVGDPPSAQ